MQEAKIPALTDFQLVEEDESSISYQAPRLSYAEKGIRVANQPILTRSYSTATISRFTSPSLTTKVTSTYKVKLDCLNRQRWISNKILIDTGASQSHCIPLPIAVSTVSEYSFVTYNGQKATLNQISRIMMKTHNSTLLEFDCYIDHLIKNEFYHILLGMNFLDQYPNYCLLYTSPSPRDGLLSRMPSSA